ALVKSEAALSIIQQLGGWFKLLLVFHLFPRSIRDRLYDEVAKHRYKWFGKKESCMIPTKEQRKRFL
ncbi:DCC1-like thiol-disulfide oxidoreductase family protein, partial [Staphylococcus sp. SIMBA_130]